MNRTFHTHTALAQGVRDLAGGVAVHLYTASRSSFALMHENYQDDAIPIDLDLQQLKVHVLAPVDLAVSKIARFDWA